MLTATVELVEGLPATNPLLLRKAYVSEPKPVAEAVRVAEVRAQLRLLLAFRLRVDAVVLLLTIVLVALVQPLALATVTEYVPDWLTTAV